MEPLVCYAPPPTCVASLKTVRWLKEVAQCFWTLFVPNVGNHAILLRHGASGGNRMGLEAEDINTVRNEISAW